MLNYKKKICILCIHPAPYRDPVIQSLCNIDQYEVTVFYYFAKDEGHLEWDYKDTSFKKIYGNKYLKLNSVDGLHLNVFFWVLKKKYDVVVIPGYSRYNSLMAIILCFLFRRPYILSSDKVSQSKTRQRFTLKLINILEKIIVSCSSALWVAGYMSRQYYNSLGVPDKKIFEGSYCLMSNVISDNVFINMREEAHSRLCDKYFLNKNAIIILSVGKFKAFRRYLNLLKAITKLNIFEKEAKSFFLFLIGDGDQMADINQYITENRVDNIVLCGNVSFTNLSTYYFGSNIFIHPGAEPYSTALEYAANCGLTIISTREVGYVHDYVRLGGKPFFVDIDNIDSMVLALTSAINFVKNCNKNNINYQNLTYPRSVEWAKNQLINAIEYASLHLGV